MNMIIDTTTKQKNNGEVHAHLVDIRDVDEIRSR